MADIFNAALQGKENDRVILYRIPKDGNTEEGVEGGTVIFARIPIYGTADAGRGFWLKLKERGSIRARIFIQPDLTYDVHFAERRKDYRSTFFEC